MRASGEAHGEASQLKNPFPTFIANAGIPDLAAACRAVASAGWRSILISVMIIEEGPTGRTLHARALEPPCPKHTLGGFDHADHTQTECD